jgi:hypothetical protein
MCGMVGKWRVWRKIVVDLDVKWMNWWESVEIVVVLDVIREMR